MTMAFSMHKSTRDGEQSRSGLDGNNEASQPQDRLTRIVTETDQSDAEDNEVSSSPNSSPSSIDRQPRRKHISWKDGDPENPYNFSTRRKVWVVIIGMVVVVNSTMGSALPSNAIPFIAKDFNVTSSYAQILPISMYLVGYILGPMVFGPLSETYGRQIVMISSFIVFTIFTMACALAQNWTSLLIFRLLTGINASCPISVIGGVFADIYGDPLTRGRAMAIFMAGTCVGPIVATLLSGFISPVKGWRWTFWIGLIAAGAALPVVLMLPETYGPILLARRARKLRASSPANSHLYAPIELEKKGWKQMVTVTLTRPLRMILFELIVSATCLYLSLAYGIFYMFFETIPIVFSGIYGQSPGVSGLMFLPIAIGAIGAVSVFFWWDSYLRKAQARNAAWTKKEEFRRLPLAVIGGPLYVFSLLWLGWTSRLSIPFYVPMLSGIPFGMGFILIFMALLNYLTDAYEIFSASAMGAASCCRSLAGAGLPFAAVPMYKKLGVPWASSLLAFLSLGMCVIPFAFIWKGDKLRERSKFCRYLKEKKLEDMATLEAQRTRTIDRRNDEKV